MDTTHKQTIEKRLRLGLVHLVLTYSYTIFLIAVIVGVVLDMIMPVSVFSAPVYPHIGAGLIMLGTVIIYWAQTTSRTKSKAPAAMLTERDFKRGPYKYSRNPTHLGLALLHLGLALILGSFFSVVCIIIASIITKFIFLKKQEKILEQKYGEAYLLYKKHVSTWV